MKHEIKNEQLTLGIDAAQNEVLAWSAISNFLEDERRPVGRKCPLFTF